MSYAVDSLPLTAPHLYKMPLTDSMFSNISDEANVFQAPNPQYWGLQKINLSKTFGSIGTQSPPILGDLGASERFAMLRNNSPAVSS
mgnify:FL=1